MEIKISGTPEEISKLLQAIASSLEQVDKYKFDVDSPKAIDQLNKKIKKALSQSIL